MFRIPTDEEYLIITMSKGEIFRTDFIRTFSSDYVNADWMVIDNPEFNYETLKGVLVILYARYTNDIRFQENRNFAAYLILDGGYVLEIERDDLERITEGKATTPHLKSRNGGEDISHWT